MTSHDLSERDVCTKFITPALVRAGWDVQTQVREEVSFTKGRIIVRGKLVTRGKAKRADYVLYYKPNIPIAIIEAKDRSHSIGDGMQQALDYATTLNIPFVFSSNGEAFLFHDRTRTRAALETELPLVAFPKPNDLWGRSRTSPDEVIVVDPDLPDGPGPDTRRRKIYVDDVEVFVMAERVEYLDEYGKLLTESLRDFTRKAVTKRFASLHDFLTRWQAEDRKQVIINELEGEGVPLKLLAEEVNPELDPFDLICHVAFDQPPLSRRERAETVRKRDVFTKYGLQARAVLEALLRKYQDEGVINLDDPRILQIAPFTAMGTPVQLVKQFGSRAAYEKAVHELQAALYQHAA